MSQVAIGTMAGKCRFYSLDKAKFSYTAQLDVCTSKARSRKITGLEYLPGQPHKVRPALTVIIQPGTWHINAYH